MKKLKVYFQERGMEIPFLLKGRRQYVRAVDGVDFTIDKNETVGLVGESGCGKTTVGKAILRLIHPHSGQIILKGKDITNLGARELRPLRSAVQMVFQNPYSSLNPRKTVEQIISKPLIVHGLREHMTSKVAQLLNMVGLSAEYARRYPHELSGGQRQRIAIARALALDPDLIVADEITTGLDVSIQARIMNLVRELQRKLGLSYLFISHDLSIVRYISDRVMVMYLGIIVESAPSRNLFKKPWHPYTEVLLSSVPVPDVKVPWNPILLEGEVPNQIEIPSGCRFHPRCHLSIPLCSKMEPSLIEIDTGHYVACHLSAKDTRTTE